MSPSHDSASLSLVFAIRISQASFVFFATLFMFFCAVALTPIGKAQSNRSVLPSATAVKQVIYAPFAGIEEFANWEIEIANRSDQDVRATVTTYSPEGEPHTPFSLLLPANQIRRIDVRGLLPPSQGNRPADVEQAQNFDKSPSNRALTVGGISVEVLAKPFAIAAQVTLSNFLGGFGNIDSILLPDVMFPSNKADAVWWQPDGGHSFLIVGNSSADPLTAVLTFGSGQGQTVTVKPNGTRRVPVPADRQDGNVQSVHVVGNGLVGALRVSGYAVSQRNAFLNVIRTYDPAISTEPAVYANGLHFSNAANHLVIKNLTGSPMNVWGTIYPISSSNSVQNVEVPKKFLTPYASAELDLPSSSDALDGAALKLESSGGAASFVASYVSHAQVNHMTRSMPFKDIGDRANTRGGYPWRLDGNYESHTYITNVGKVRAAFGAFIDPKNGDRYVIDTHFLEPGETTIIDYRQLRDEQTQDRNGVVLPKKVDSGAVQWFPLFFDGSQYFIGRTEVLDSSTGVASSFSCGSCPCSPNVNSAYTSPSSATVPVGGTAPILVRATMRDPCNINPIPDMTFVPTSWSTPPFFTLTAGSTPSILRGVSPGSGLYITSFITDDWVYNGPFQNPQCSSTQRINTPEGTGTVKPPAQLLVIGDTYIIPTNCPNTKERILAYQIQDADGADIKLNLLTREQFASKTANTCGNGVTTSETCSGTPSGIIHDTLSVGCNKVGNGCGYTFTKQQWVWCSVPSSTVIGTVGDLVVHDNSISVGGSFTSIRGKVIKP